jgi:hypothetical protein
VLVELTMTEQRYRAVLRRPGRPAAAGPASPNPGTATNDTPEQATTTGGFPSVDFPATGTSSPNGHHGYDLNGTAPYGIR